jgi:CspA family cold shock protein
MYRGKIKSIERSKGYGFIEMTDGDIIFFHQRWLRKVSFRDLNESDEVVFNIIAGPRGPRASHIKPASDQTVNIKDIKFQRLEALFKD